MVTLIEIVAGVATGGTAVNAAGGGNTDNGGDSGWDSGGGR